LAGWETNGKLIIVGVPEKPIEVSTLPLIMGNREIHGWASGTAWDSEDTLNFSVLTGVKPKIEVYPLEEGA